MLGGSVGIVGVGILVMVVAGMVVLMMGALVMEMVAFGGIGGSDGCGCGYR